MLSAKLVLVVCLQMVCVFGVLVQTSDQVRQRWKDNKLSTLYDIVMSPLYSGQHVTVIGWQYVHDNEGNVKEVKTIEVSFMKDENLRSKFDLYHMDMNKDVMDQYPYIVDKLNEEKAGNLNFLVSGQSWNIDGSLEKMVFIDSNDIILNGDDGDVYIIRNSTVNTLEDVKTFAEQHQLASLIVYNPNGTFNEKESAVMPELDAYITGQTGASQDMMEDAIRAVSNGYLTDREDITDYVASRMTKEYPKYVWTVVEGHSGSFTTRDVHIGVEYQTAGIHEYDVTVDIFGREK